MKSRGRTISMATWVLAAACGGVPEEGAREEPGRPGLHSAALETQAEPVPASVAGILELPPDEVELLRATPVPAAPELLAETAVEDAEARASQPSPLTVWANGCQYTLTLDSGFPPILRSLNLTREPSPNCEARTVNLVGSSPPFLQPQGLVLAEKRNELVVAWRRTINPMYGITALFIRHISPETLETVRSESLTPFYKSGSITGASLEFHGHRLIIHGTKTGVFSPSEPSGAYPRFTATYPHFFTSTERPELVLHE